MTSPKALQRMLQQANCDSFTLPFAMRGPGGETGPDWVAIFEVDQQSSTGAAKEHRWLVIQGHSKKRDALGTTAVKPVKIWEEEQELHPLGKHTATLYLFETDEEVPVDWHVSDVFCIGQEQHVAYYGPVGCLRREAIAEPTGP